MYILSIEIKHIVLYCIEAYKPFPTYNTSTADDFNKVLAKNMKIPINEKRVELNVFKCV